MVGSGNDQAFGISDIRPEIAQTYNVGLDNSAYGYISAFINGTASGNYGAMGGNGTVFQIAIDMDNSKVWLGINNSWIASGNPSTGANSFYTPILTTTYYPYFLGYTSGVTAYNFGQRPFTYTAPSGFVALNTYNLPTPTILQGNKYMDASLYTGDGSSSLTAVNQAQFKPDFVWLKSRSAATDHKLFDSVRGVQKQLTVNTGIETTQTTSLSAFNTNGFTIGALANVNTSAATYVGWQWQAGQGTTTVNTSGATSSNVSVNSTAGFSIVTYTGTGANTTIGHGLSSAPKMIMVKNRTAAGQDWTVYHSSLGATKRIYLNTSAAENTSSGAWNNTTPTSTVFSIGTLADVNQSTANIVAYCWAEIAGFSKFGSYVGNGSADGPFVFLGFRPKFIMVKGNVAGVDWAMSDSSRNTYNVVNGRLQASISGSPYGAEDTSDSWCDFLSNGFKIRSTNSNQNYNTYTFIYMAYAENPFKNSNAR